MEIQIILNQGKNILRDVHHFISHVKIEILHGDLNILKDVFVKKKKKCHKN